MQLPLISVVIATYNSEKTLPLVLDSIKKQSYPKDKIETIVIDGGSKDKTLTIIRKNGCKLLKNPKVDQVFAKFIGYKKAHGKYLILLDSDEVLDNKNSIKNKALAMLEDERVKVVISSGLSKPDTYSDITYYVNEYGDPFSFFMYGISKDPTVFIRQLENKYKTDYKDLKKVVFDFSKEENPPFIELTAMGVMVNLEYIKKSLPNLLKFPSLHTHLFYLINNNNNLFSIMKNDNIVHYSAPSFGNYLNKIKTRVRSNVFKTEMGKAGFEGREKYYSSWYKLKKYLFIFYTISLVLPLIDALFLYLRRGRKIYFVHPFLCIYTISTLAYYYILKVFGIKIILRGYGT
ncbi:glycosyltransferase [Candidatus Woesebacteria bacterium]|nr:glycosyltransferase [Candidatus Woesebacteria bacterium]